MLAIDLIGPTRPIQISSKCKVDKLLNIKVIKSQDKKIKAQRSCSETDEK